MILKVENVNVKPYFSGVVAYPFVGIERNSSSDSWQWSDPSLNPTLDVNAWWKTNPSSSDDLCSQITDYGVSPRSCGNAPYICKVPAQGKLILSLKYFSGG